MPDEFNLSLLSPSDIEEILHDEQKSKQLAVQLRQQVIDEGVVSLESLKKMEQELRDMELVDGVYNPNEEQQSSDLEYFSIVSGGEKIFSLSLGRDDRVALFVVSDDGSKSTTRLSADDARSIGVSMQAIANHILSGKKV